MRVIGIDPGTAITGWGVVEGDGNDLTMIAGGVVTTAAGTPLPERLQIIYRELTEIVTAVAAGLFSHRGVVF